MTYRVYKIISKPAISQTKATICSLNISMKNDNQTGEKLNAVIDWVNNNFNHCIINIADTLQRHNYLSQGYSLNVAKEKSIKAGNDWLNKNDHIINQLNIPKTIVRWDDWLSSIEVFNNLQKVYTLFNNDEKFKSCVFKDVNKWLARQSKYDKENAQTNAINFLLEEIAIHSFIATKTFNEGNVLAHCYPAKQLNSEQYLRDIHPALGLEKSIFIRQKIETRSNSNFSKLPLLENVSYTAA